MTRFRTIRQHDSTECGANCIRMVASHLIAICPFRRYAISPPTDMAYHRLPIWRIPQNRITKPYIGGSEIEEGVREEKAPLSIPSNDEEKPCKGLIE